MKQLLGYLFAGLIAEILGQNLENGVSQMPFCYNTSSGSTCFTTFLDNNRHAVRTHFDTASDWCKTHVPDSSLIMINSLEEERTVGSFIGGIALENETIIMDAQRLRSTTRFKWIWTNGDTAVPREIENKELYSHGGACVELKQGQSLTYCVGAVSISYRYICVLSDSRINASHRQNNKSYFARQNRATWFDARLDCLQLGGDLITDIDLLTVVNWSWLQKGNKYWIGLLQKKWIWKITGAALTYANWEGGYPNAYDNGQCICIHPRCRTENRETISCDNNRNWRICNCNNSYAIVCQKGYEYPRATHPLKPLIPTVSNSTDSTLHMTDFTEGETSVWKISSSGQLSSISEKQILLVVLLVVGTIFIIVTLVLIFRRHKLSRCTKSTEPSVYASVVRENRPPEDTAAHGGDTYTCLKMIQQPAPTSNEIYACVQPSEESVDLGRNVVYADLDLQRKGHQQKSKSADNIVACLSPIYAEPFESPCSTVYAEPFNPHKGHTATAPIRDHHTTVGDQ